MSTFDNLTLTGKATQMTAATGAQDLIRLGEAQALVSSMFQGAWDADSAYLAGQMVIDAGALWLAVAPTTGLEPNDNPD